MPKDAPDTKRRKASWLWYAALLLPWLYLASSLPVYVGIGWLNGGTFSDSHLNVLYWIYWPIHTSLSWLGYPDEFSFAVYGVLKRLP